MDNGTLASVDKYFGSDAKFNELYPSQIQKLSRWHWTPLDIAKQAASFLAGPGEKVLDIGSGVGKFCLAGAHYNPTALFYGVEQRKYLIEYGERAQRLLGVRNANFTNANFTQLNLHEFDHFYFFNSFYENLDDAGRIDENIAYSEALYEYYVKYLYKGLEQMPIYTKVVTFHSFDHEIPRDYELIDSYSNGDLKFWMKL